MAKYILKAFFLTTFPSTQKHVQKSMLLHWCCPLTHSGIYYLFAKFSKFIFLPFRGGGGWFQIWDQNILFPKIQDARLILKFRELRFGDKKSFILDCVMQKITE